RHRDHRRLHRGHAVRQVQPFLHEHPEIHLCGLGDRLQRVVFRAAPRCTARQARNPRDPVPITFLRQLNVEDITGTVNIFFNRDITNIIHGWCSLVDTLLCGSSASASTSLNSASMVLRSMMSSLSSGVVSRSGALSCFTSVSSCPSRRLYFASFSLF